MSGAAPAPGAPSSYTLDELARHTGVASRTIRFYQSQGILPPPERRGRIAVYGEAHVDLLRLVALLQDRGLRLSAIRDAVRHAAPDALSLHDWIGLDERLRRAWIDDEPRTLSDSELRTLLRDHPGISVEALHGAGLARAEMNGRSHVVPSPALLDITLQLDAAGIDFDTAVAAGALMQQALSPLAQQLVGHFVERIGAGFGRATTPGELARALDALRPLGVEAARVVFGREVQRAIRALLAETPPSPSTPRRRSRTYSAAHG